ncbi:MAG: MlaE family ABC transporter permease [Bacteroidia bacterium]
MVTSILFHIGRYFMLMGGLMRTPEKFSVYYRLTLAEVISMTIGSMVIVVVISTFIGGVTTLQTAYQLVSDFIPKSTIGSVVSASTFLELAPTVLTFILAGRIGSRIASEIGTMRVTEQIDAIEVMGINSSGYLILPRIAGALISFPILVTISAFLHHIGGSVAGDISGAVKMDDFNMGVQMWFEPVQVRVMYIKSFVFGFLVSSISAYHGYYTSGGALEVGQSSTKAVVYSCLAMVIADYFIAQILL